MKRLISLSLFLSSALCSHAQDVNKTLTLDEVTVHLTSSLRHPKILIKEFSYFLMPCHQHGLRINLLV